MSLFQSMYGHGRYRHPDGRHMNGFVADFEEESWKYFTLLQNVATEFSNPHRIEDFITETLIPIQETLNTLEEQAAEMPFPWLQRFQLIRAKLEDDVNRHYFTGYGYDVDLPWGQPEIGAYDIRNEYGIEGALVGDLGGFGDPDDRFDFHQYGLAELEWHGEAHEAAPPGGFGHPQRAFEAATFTPNAFDQPLLRGNRQEFFKSNPKSAPGRSHGSAATSAMNLSVPSRESPLAAIPGSSHAESSKSGSVNLEEQATYFQRRREVESINPDIARFGGIVNPFYLDEDPLSRPLQQGKEVTFIDKNDVPQYVFSLTFRQSDEFSQNLAKIANLEGRREHEKRPGKAIDLLEAAIQDGKTLKEIAKSKKAGGTIWTTDIQRQDLFEIVKENQSLGNWALFGVGTGMSEKRLFLIQFD